MTRRRARRKPPRKNAPPAAAPPVDVRDGIPDAAAGPKIRQYALLAIIFLTWLGFLVYCAFAASV